MIPKFRCDGCNEELRILIKDKPVYALNDDLNGLSLICHNNLKNQIIFCGSCFEEFENKLKEDGDYLSLHKMDEVEDFVRVQDLKNYIKKWGF